MIRGDSESMYNHTHEINDEDTINKDLDRLVSLAEDISENVQIMNLKIIKIKQGFFWLLGLAYIFIAVGLSIYHLNTLNTFEPIHKILFYIGALTFVLLVTILLSTMINNLRKLKQDMRIEKSILIELLDMIHELENASHYSSLVDPISNALLKMRLKRIYFTI